MLLDLAFAPWIYLVGGRVRLVPIWAGSGVLEAPWGGVHDLSLFLSHPVQQARISRRAPASQGVDGYALRRAYAIACL